MQVSHSPARVATKAFFERMKLTRASQAIASAAKVATAAAAPIVNAHRFGNGFLTAYTKEHRDAILASDFVVIDFETTGMTPYSKPVSVGN